MAGDPTGSATGGASDVVAANPATPTLQELAAEVGHTKIASNFVWMLLAGFPRHVYAGRLCFLRDRFHAREKRIAHDGHEHDGLWHRSARLLGLWLRLANGWHRAVAALGNTGPLASEYTISIAGHSFGLFGTERFLSEWRRLRRECFWSLPLLDGLHGYRGDDSHRRDGGALEVGLLRRVCIVHVDVRLPDLWKLGLGWWLAFTTRQRIWLGPWTCRFRRFVGRASGWWRCGVCWRKDLGPRIGKYEPDGRVNTIPGHDMPMAILGVLILAFGWFGFNAGSTLSGGDLRIAVVAVNTMLGSAAGAVSAMIAISYLRGKPDLSFMANGMLAGLVAVTGPCAFINSTGAVLIGLIAGVLLVGATIFVEHRLKVDDPVGAISVHGVNGAWGVIAVGLFADGTYGAGLNGVAGGVRGLFYGGGMGQLTAEIVGAVACIAFAFTAFHVFFKIVGYLIGNRVSAAVELEGLDIGEIGVPAYPEFLPVPARHDSATGNRAGRCEFVCSNSW